MKAAWVDTEDLEESFALAEARGVLLQFYADLSSRVDRRIKSNDVTRNGMRQEIRLALGIASVCRSEEECMALAAVLYDLQRE
jgi:hypothetical protein